MWKKGVAAFLWMACFSYADPAMIFSFKEIYGELETADEQTLLVLDVDEVLITTEDHFMHPYAEDAVVLLIMEKMIFLDSEEEKKNLEDTLSLSLTLPKRVLIEQQVPSLIQDLQVRGVKVIALTSCPTGPLGKVNKVEHWRIDQLKSLSLDFSLAFPSLEAHFLPLSKGKKSPPLYEKGILFSKGYKKGEVLNSFLAEGNFIPSKVIFLDDLLENVESVESSLREMKIDGKGYQYTGASRFFRPSVSEPILKKQFEHLLETQTWLSDAEIEKSL